MLKLNPKTHKSQCQRQYCPDSAALPVLPYRTLALSHLTEQHLSQRKHLNGKMKHYDDSWERSEWKKEEEGEEIEIESVYCELQNNEL